MLDYHKANKADVTIACMPVPIEEASRFGVMITDGNGRITSLKKNRSIQEQFGFYGYIFFLAGAERIFAGAERSAKL